MKRTVCILLLAYCVCCNMYICDLFAEKNVNTEEKILSISMNYNVENRSSLLASDLKKRLIECINVFGKYMKYVYITSSSIPDIEIDIKEYKDAGLTSAEYSPYLNNGRIQIISIFSTDGKKLYKDSLSMEFEEKYVDGWYTDKEMNSGEKVCIPCYGLYCINSNEWKLNGEVYKVIGHGKKDDYGGPLVEQIVIPFYALADTMEIDEIAIVFNSTINKGQFDEFVSLMETYFGSNYIINQNIAQEVNSLYVLKRDCIVTIIFSIVCSVVLFRVLKKVLSVDWFWRYVLYISLAGYTVCTLYYLYMKHIMKNKSLFPEDIYGDKNSFILCFIFILVHVAIINNLLSNKESRSR